VTGGDRDVHPVDVGNDADEEQEKENSPTDASGLSGMRGWGKVHGERMKNIGSEFWGRLLPLALACCVPWGATFAYKVGGFGMVL